MTKLFKKDSDCCFENQRERQGANCRSQEVKRQEGSGRDDGLRSSCIWEARETRYVNGLDVG